MNERSNRLLFAADLIGKWIAENADGYQARYGIEINPSLDQMFEYASRAGFNPDFILKGDWTWREVEPIVIGYLSRLRDQPCPRKMAKKWMSQARLSARQSIILDLLIEYEALSFEAIARHGNFDDWHDVRENTRTHVKAIGKKSQSEPWKIIESDGGCKIVLRENIQITPNPPQE